MACTKRSRPEPPARPLRRPTRPRGGVRLSGPATRQNLPAAAAGAAGRSREVLPSLALRTLPKEKGTHPGAYRQKLENFNDIQYFGEINVGGQALKGVLDTGSFDLVVFGKSCDSCGTAGLYSDALSRSFIPGRRVHEHAYGSGSCQTQDVRDAIAVGPLAAQNQSFWMATKCQMPLLQQALFNAIIGIGPPGQPLRSAEKLLEQYRSMEAECKRMGTPMPEAAHKAMLAAQEDIADAPGKLSLLQSLGVATFSACLGRSPGSPAWLVWNDARFEQRPDAKRAPVVGKVSWGVHVEGVGLSSDGGEAIKLGCATGCGAVLDTGTSLLGVPTAIYDGVRQFIVDNNFDCSDLSQFPSLTMSIGGHEVHLPPDSYVGSLRGQMNTEVEGYMTAGGSAGCQLLLLDLGTEMTQFGPMLIMGMPFFRQFYTTFDLGEGGGNRSVFFTLADDSCHPVQQHDFHGAAALHRARRAMRPRVVDASRVQLPAWLRTRRDINI